MNVSFVSDENFFLRNMFPFISGTYVLTQCLIYSSKLIILVVINLRFPNDYNSQFNFICRILISIHFYDNVNVPWRIAMNICNILAYLLTRHHILFLGIPDICTVVYSMVLVVFVGLGRWNIVVVVSPTGDMVIVWTLMWWV